MIKIAYVQIFVDQMSDFSRHTYIETRCELLRDDPQGKVSSKVLTRGQLSLWKTIEEAEAAAMAAVKTEEGVKNERQNEDHESFFLSL
jgi:hypothetical protein